MEVFKNIALNMKASGPAAVLCIYIMAIAAVGVLDNGPVADKAVNILAVLGPILIFSLAQKT